MMKGQGTDNSAQDPAADDDGLTIEYCKAWKTRVEKKREDYLKQYQASWREIKKLGKNGRQLSLDIDKRKSLRYPAWNNTLKIRKPLVLARNPEPVGKDTAPGNDPVGRTAAILYEKLAKGLRDSSQWDIAVPKARDDYLVSDFAMTRFFYHYEEVTEPVQKRLIPGQDVNGQPVLTDEEGNVVPLTDKVMQDEQGPFIETEEVVSVKDETITQKHVLAENIYIDPNAIDWDDVHELAYATDYTKEEFETKFGKEQLGAIGGDLSRELADDSNEKIVRVFEFWRKKSRTVRYFAETGTRFLQPPNDLEGLSLDDPYDLLNFYPSARPLKQNAPVDNFYPITEFYQIQDLIEEIHVLYARRWLMGNAIKAKLMYDKSLPGLEEAINNLGDAGTLGIPGLKGLISDKNYRLDAFVFYLPINDLITAFGQLNTTFAEKLNEYFQQTGTADLIRGQTDQVERTLGEQQMKAKYSMSQLGPYQEDMQRWCADDYELMCEMALKSFQNPESFKKYIQPETLDPEDLQRYDEGLELLKNDNSRRFRLELNTDSMIALNEQFIKQDTAEATNAFTKALEYTAKVIKEEPALAKPMIKMLQQLAKSYRLGKNFTDEMDQSLEEIITKISAPPTQAPPDPQVVEMQTKAQIAQGQQSVDMAEVNLGAQKLAQEAQDSQFERGYKQMQLQFQVFQEKFDQFIERYWADIEAQKAGAEIENKAADNERMSKESQISAIEALKPSMPEKEVVVVPPSEPSPTVIVNQTPP